MYILIYISYRNFPTVSWNTHNLQSINICLRTNGYYCSLICKNLLFLCNLPLFSGEYNWNCWQQTATEDHLQTKDMTGRFDAKTILKRKRHRSRSFQHPCLVQSLKTDFPESDQHLDPTSRGRGCSTVRSASHVQAQRTVKSINDVEHHASALIFPNLVEIHLWLTALFSIERSVQSHGWIRTTTAVPRIELVLSVECQRVAHH